MRRRVQQLRRCAQFNSCRKIQFFFQSFSFGHDVELAFFVFYCFVVCMCFWSFFLVERQHPLQIKRNSVDQVFYWLGFTVLVLFIQTKIKLRIYFFFVCRLRVAWIGLAAIAQHRMSGREKDAREEYDYRVANSIRSHVMKSSIDLAMLLCIYIFQKRKPRLLNHKYDLHAIKKKSWF